MYAETLNVTVKSRRIYGDNYNLYTYIITVMMLYTNFKAFFVNYNFSFDVVHYLN